MRRHFVQFEVPVRGSRRKIWVRLEAEVAMQVWHQRAGMGAVVRSARFAGLPRDSGGRARGFCAEAHAHEEAGDSADGDGLVF